MPKFKIIIGDMIYNKRSGARQQRVDVSRLSAAVGEEWSHKHFESRAEAQEAYHALIAKLEGEVNRVQETLDAVVEHGHIVEVE